MKVTKTGTLYGIGVGPGDPELLPVKSAKILGKVDVVFAASSTKNSYSLAVNIVKSYIPETTNIIQLSFPMTKDPLEKQKVWDKHAKAIINELKKGRDAAFVTLGDPMTYSTFSYILSSIRKNDPSINSVTIPGITSYQAAAARLNIPLVEGEESLLILSGVEGGKHLRNFKGRPDNVVFLKAYKNVKDITFALEELEMIKNSVGILNCGLGDEEIIKDIKELCKRQPDYWTLVISKKKDYK